MLVAILAKAIFIDDLVSEVEPIESVANFDTIN